MTADHAAQPLDLDAIRAREAAATEGPWSADPTGTVCADADLVPDGNGGEILPDQGPMEVAECYRNEKPGERGANAEFIAHAREDVPALLAGVERLRGLLGQTTAALNVALSLAIPRAGRVKDDQECIEGCREALRQAVAELHPQAPTTPKPESAALIAAVDKLTEGSGR